MHREPSVSLFAAPPQAAPWANLTVDQLGAALNSAQLAGADHQSRHFMFLHRHGSGGPGQR